MSFLPENSAAQKLFIAHGFHPLDVASHRHGDPREALIWHCPVPVGHAARQSHAGWRCDFVVGNRKPPPPDIACSGSGSGVILSCRSQFTGQRD
jgi:hypothetical protein